MLQGDVGKGKRQPKKYLSGSGQKPASRLDPSLGNDARPLSSSIRSQSGWNVLSRVGPAPDPLVDVATNKHGLADLRRSCKCKSRHH
jgi:hypothetical protein